VSASDSDTRWWHDALQHCSVLFAGWSWLQVNESCKLMAACAAYTRTGTGLQEHHWLQDKPAAVVLVQHMHILQASVAVQANQVSCPICQMITRLNTLMCPAGFQAATCCWAFQW
jgi:hypothetical protein